MSGSDTPDVGQRGGTVAVHLGVQTVGIAHQFVIGKIGGAVEYVHLREFTLRFGLMNGLLEFGRCNIFLPQ
jgi:hypothetical protein